MCVVKEKSGRLAVLPGEKQAQQDEIGLRNHKNIHLFLLRQGDRDWRCGCDVVGVGESGSTGGDLQAS